MKISSDNLEAVVSSLEAVANSLTNPNAIPLPAVRGLIARIAEAASALTGTRAHLCLRMLCYDFYMFMGVR